MFSLREIFIKAKLNIENTNSLSKLELIRIKYLGRNGYFNKILTSLNNFNLQKKIKLNIEINQIKKNIKQIIQNHKLLLEKKLIDLKIKSEILDISLPGRRNKIGSIHPISNAIIDIENFFKNLGFGIFLDKEIDNSNNNFYSLNIPNYHPVYNFQDTFWLDSKRLLRTQTSSSQIKIMRTHKPPIRIISYGKVYRNDYDLTHTPMFHQVEGLVIDHKISFANLKNTLYDFLHDFFKNDIEIRFRPSYFPFTEPSAEIDIKIENNEWLEILGCGMIHPNILMNQKINKKIYSGFSFGIGIERLIMLRYNIKDLRIFFENDIRFLKQFR